MEQLDLRKLLLSSAFHAMACDGEIHQEELKVIHELSNNSSFFLDLDLDRELVQLADELKQSTRGSFRSYFQGLRNEKLELIEQFLVVEVVLRIIYADQRIDDNEILFLRSVTRNLGLHPELLKERFGAINSLLGTETREEFKKLEPQTPSFVMPNVEELKGLKMLSANPESETASEDHENPGP